MAKMCKEMNCDQQYNFKDRSDKQVYDTKINVDMQRQKDELMKKERAKIGPPNNIEPTHTPNEEFTELAMFQAKFVTALKNRDIDKLP